MPDNSTTEQLLQEIRDELRQLRQAFEERNRIIDAQYVRIANAQPDPPVDQLTTAVNDLQQRDLQRRVQGMIETWVKMIAAQYDKGSAYINIIIVGGYAAFFGLWTTSRSLLPPNQVRWSAILMIISVSLFVVFAVWDMIRSTLHMHRYQYIFTNIQNENDPDVITRAFRSYEDEYNRHRNRLILFGWSSTG